MEIKKVKLTKNRSLEISYDEAVISDQGTGNNEVTMKCSFLVHIDMLESLKALRKYLVDICGFPFGIDIEGMPEELDNYNINGFTVAGEEYEGAGVCIIGSKKTANGVLNITTPFIKYEEYEYNSLQTAINKCIEETIEYVNGKCAVKQTEINFDEADEQNEVMIAEQPKRDRRKKVDEAALTATA
jgi:hypothetical protein